MAVAYQSIQTASATDTSTVTVTKPTSLAVGDFMLGVVANGGKNDPATVAALSGWTQVSNTNAAAGGFNLDTTTLGKVATSADVAASNFTFDVTNATDVVLGSILRFTGIFSTVGASVGFDADTGGVSGANTFTGGLTPSEANTVLVLGMSTGGGNSNTHSAYSVANNNPTWTERADFGNSFNDGSSTDFLYYGIATSTFTVDTATGNYSATNSGSSVDNGHGFIISINESPVSVTVSPSQLTVASSLPTPTLATDTIITPSALSVVSSTPSSVIGLGDETVWTGVSKPSTTWTNLNKP